MNRVEAMERAQEFLKVAEMALKADCYQAAALCVYAALYWAAIAALSQVGVQRSRWSHGGLRDAFRNELVRQRRKCPESFVSWLEDAYELRVRAHYELVGASVKRVRRLVNHAAEFVKSIKEATAL
jgi:uncharacterized protein (UPF0332 family)